MILEEASLSDNWEIDQGRCRQIKAIDNGGYEDSS